MPQGALTGSRIRDRRMSAGMRQADLAKAAGISASYLNLIEHNRRRIGGKLVADIARALGCEITALTEGAEAMLLASLREAAAGPGGRDAELDRAEEFAGRFPGWSGLLAERHARVQRLEAEVAALSDRLAHDPHLSASLHELLTAITAVRSSASILAGTEDLDPAWASRFLAILDAEGRRLSEVAEALVRHLDEPGARPASAATPQEEVEALFAARGWHLSALEKPDAGDRAISALLDGAAELETDAGRALARRAALRYRDDARRLPLAEVSEVADAGVGALVERFAAPVDAVLRRLALLPGREAGLVIADGAGAITFRRPLSGFALPRHGAACPLWPLFQALARPAVPVSTVVRMPGEGARRILAEAIALPVGPPDFAGPPVFEATMLLTQAGDDDGPALPVGPTCRICVRDSCRARREPSILARTRP